MQVSINMAQSIDGKIASRLRGPVKLGSNYDSLRMKEIRALHDIIIMGARTFEAYPKPLLVNKSTLVRARVRKGYEPEPATGVVSSKLNFLANSEWEKSSYLRLAFCGKSPQKTALNRLRKNGVFIARSKSENLDPRDILKVCQDLGFDRVLLEGGGELNALFLEHNLVDRLFITLCPLLIGGRDAPTIFEGNGFLPKEFPRFRLSEAKKKGDELYLIYNRK